MGLFDGETRKIVTVTIAKSNMHRSRQVLDCRTWQDMCDRAVRPAACDVAKISGRARPVTQGGADLIQAEPMQYNTRHHGAVSRNITPLCRVLYGKTDV